MQRSVLVTLVSQHFGSQALSLQMDISAANLPNMMCSGLSGTHASPVCRLAHLVSQIVGISIVHLCSCTFCLRFFSTAFSFLRAARAALRAWRAPSNCSAAQRSASAWLPALSLYNESIA